MEGSPGHLSPLSHGWATRLPPLEPGSGALLTDGIRGAMVVGRIWGSPCPSSFWTWNDMAQVSLGTPTPVPWVPMGAAPSPSQHDPRLCVCCPAKSPSPQPVPPGVAGPAAVLTSGSVRASTGGPVLGPLICTRFASWMERRGQSCGGLSPPGRHRGALSPCWDVSGPRSCPYPSPGTVGWRRRGRHRRTATPNPPASQCNEQTDGLGGNQLLPWALLPQRQIQPGAGCQGCSPDPPPCEGPRGASSVHGTRRRLQPVGVRRKALLPSRT